MKILQWEILNYLTDYCIGKENAISGYELADLFNLSRANLRQHLSVIKKKQDLIIGSDKLVGYYIPLQTEVKEALAYTENKSLGHLINSLHQRPAFALKVYKMLNETLKTLPKEQQDQLDMDNVAVNYVGDKYKENRK